MGNRVEKGCNAMLRMCDMTVVNLLVQLVNLVNFGFCLASVHHNFWDLVWLCPSSCLMPQLCGK
jgi:hypothetical protein